MYGWRITISEKQRTNFNLNTLSKIKKTASQITSLSRKAIVKDITKGSVPRNQF
jgi:hypothetical protein